MRVVVATVVHHPSDARIFHRQIEALLSAGHEVTYLAPFDRGGTPSRDGLSCRELPRSRGWRRLSSLRAASTALAEETIEAHVAIVHDPELTLLGRSISCPKVFDIHEDLRAQVEDKDWIPRLFRPVGRILAAMLEERATKRFELMLAEDSYLGRYPSGVVIRNRPVLPDKVKSSGNSRLVYVGRVSLGRGLETMLAANRLVGNGRTLDLYGPVDSSAQALLAENESEGTVVSHGFTAGPAALQLIQGAMAGLSLLRDLPNYRHSMPTKILEYMANGVPVITTPLPEACRLVEETGAGIVVPFDDPEAVADAVETLSDPAFRQQCSDNGRRAVAERYDWATEAGLMVDFLEGVATGDKG